MRSQTHPKTYAKGLAGIFPAPGCGIDEGLFFTAYGFALHENEKRHK